MTARFESVSIAIIVGALASATKAQTLDLSWNTIDGGGTMFIIGGVFELSGTIGQPDAGPLTQPMTGGVFELVGGFWSIQLMLCVPGDTDGDGDVDLGDLATLLAHFGTSGGAGLEDGDFDRDGDVDLADLAILLANFGTTP